MVEIAGLIRIKGATARAVQPSRFLPQVTPTKDILFIGHISLWAAQAGPLERHMLQDHTNGEFVGIGDCRVTRARPAVLSATVVNNDYTDESATSTQFPASYPLLVMV